MADREKTLAKLEECLSASCRGFRTCPYNDDEWDAVRAAYELLKVQEPVEPSFRQMALAGQWDTVPFCGACGTLIGHHSRFCPNCGREVKRDGKQ